MRIPDLQEDFYDFRDGAKQDDATIQEHINQCMRMLNENKETNFARVACGNVVVVGLRFGDSIDIIVSRSYVEATYWIENGAWIA